MSKKNILFNKIKSGCLNFIAKLFTQNGTFFTFMIILGITTNFITEKELNIENFFATILPDIVFDISILCIILTIIKGKISLWIKIILYVIMYSISMVDVFCFVKFKTTINPSMLLLVGETNSQEASEFLNSFLNINTIISPLFWIIIILLMNIIWAIFKRKFQSILSFIKPKQTIKTIAKLTFLCGFILSIVLSYKNKIATIHLLSLPNMGAMEHELTKTRECAKHYLPMHRLMFSTRANYLVGQQTTKLIEAKNNVKVDSCKFTSKNIVLIIGESANKHHSSLYGYKKPTTPQQIKLKKTRQLTAFSDVVSPWNLTSYVFKLLFSTYSNGMEGEWCDYALFPQLFKTAGYNVTFLTNQFMEKPQNEVFDFSGGFFLSNEELSKSMFNYRNNQTFKLDENLVNHYKSLNIDYNKPNLIIFHLIGQHVAYSKRYPKNRRKFTENDYERNDLSKKQVKILADYDNATLYNDSILNAIVNLFKNKDAVVVYVPDHAEECFDGIVNTYCRLHSTDIDARLAREEFEIPFWIWCSKKYINNHREVFYNIKNSAKKPFMTDLLAQILLYLGGISCKEYHDTLNILSPNYNINRPRLLKATTDYNKLIEKKQNLPAKDSRK